MVLGGGGGGGGGGGDLFSHFAGEFGQDAATRHKVKILCCMKLFSVGLLSFENRYP